MKRNKIKCLKVAGLITAATIVPLMLASCGGKEEATGTPSTSPSTDVAPTPTTTPGGDAESTSTAKPGSDATSTPTPEVKRNTITFKADSNFTLEASSVAVVDKEQFQLEVPNLESMFEFEGWYTASGEQITDNEGKSLEAWNSALGDIELVARYATRVTYEEVAGGLRVKGNDLTSELVELIIPEIHDGKMVVEVGDFSNHKLLKKVSLPSSLDVISETAFKDSLALEEINVYTVKDKVNFTSENGVLYTDNGATLFKYPINKEGESFEVPASVTKIAAHAFEGYTSFGSETGFLKEVYLPATIEEIGDYAFSQMATLRKVEFALGRTELKIGNHAFSFTKIENFKIPENTVAIGDYAFAADLFSSLQTIDLGEDLVLPEGLKSIGNNAFEFNTSLKKVTLSSTIESIGARAFKSSSISEIVFPENGSFDSISDEMLSTTNILEIEVPSYIKTIGKNAFSKNYLTAIKLNEGLITIGDGAFMDNQNLTHINIPGSVTALGEGWLNNCPAIGAGGIEVDPDSKVLAEEDGVIYNGSKTEIFLFPADRKSDTYIMPDTLESIPSRLFENNEVIKHVTLSKSLRVIPEYAFYGCEIDKIIIPASVEEIYDSAFGSYQSRAVRAIEFAEGSKLKLVAKGAFRRAEIKSLTLPDGVLVVGEGAFIDSKIETLNLPASLESFASDSFASASSKIKAINVNEKNEHYISKDGVLYTKDLKTLVVYPKGKAAANTYTLPVETTRIAASGMQRANIVNLVGENVSVVEANAFYKANKIETINMPRLTEIEDGAFKMASKLRSITLDNVRSIGIEAFSDCTKLTSLKIGKELTEINQRAFANSGLASVVIPGNISKIGDGAFINTPLTRLEIEEGVELIGKEAFKDTTKLTELILPNSLHEIKEEAFMVTGEKGEALLSELNIPSGVKLLGDGAFTGNSLSKIAVAEDNRWLKNDEGNSAVLSIDGTKIILAGSKAINGEYKVADGVVELASGLFINAKGLTKLSLSSTVKILGKNLISGASSLAEFSVADSNQYFKVQDGVLFTADMKKLVYYPAAKESTKYEIPAGVTEVGEYAFYQLGSSCKLNELIMPESLVTRYQSSFSSFRSLKTLEINSQEMINKLKYPNLAGYDADPITAYVTTLRIKNGLKVNSYITEDFEPAQEQNVDGYVIYVEKANL